MKNQFYRKKMGSFVFFLAIYFSISPLLSRDLINPIIRTSCLEITHQDFAFLKTVKDPIPNCKKLPTFRLYQDFEQYCSKKQPCEKHFSSLPEKLEALRQRRKEVQELKQNLKKSKSYFQSLGEIQNYQYLFDRLVARESFLGHLLTLSERIELCRLHPLTKVEGDSQILESFILAWNPGHYPKQSLTKLAEQFKLKHGIHAINFDEALEFYLWVDEVLNGSKNARIPTSVIRDCSQNYLEYPKNMFKAKFSTRGEVMVRHPQLQNKITKLNDLITYNYIINPKGDLYIQEALHGGHVDIIRGGHVLCAGEIIFRNQKIYKMNNESGHYLPSIQDLKESYNFLKNKYGEHIFDQDFTLNAYEDE